MLEIKMQELIDKRHKIPDEFWILSENGHRVIWVLDQEDGTAGSYQTSQERIGITKEGNILWGFSSGCSCWGGWDSGDYCPTMSAKEFTLDVFDKERQDRVGYNWENLQDFKNSVHANLEDFLLLVADNIEPKRVLEAQNAEVRRYLIKRIGYENIKEDVKAEVLHKDGDNELLRFNTGEMYVKVKDSSTDREYLLYVQGNHETCKSAIAWTFGLREHEYNPIIET